MCCPQEVTGEQAEPMSHSQVCLVRTKSSSFVLGMCVVAFPLPFSFILSFGQELDLEARPLPVWSVHGLPLQ